ncbi:hypothetical protein lacNasYZ03_16650 [Lactobacillus nasalidis]|uniref:Uncharacterized protein n=1 Tax=Lactobacillus nasalidis TaxID=2797258 RepID=A0ABQ3W7C3_9LACO|nr:hypothetical protein [Lactobacillus nasalidis]GHV98277.1 hypothetical protein lacNasYZ01_14590 [Lactobacillus nasalidis]GHV99402.1 hypothetical protein lacNasYZ02_08320 [Lactobacillus nasalidis]GHW01978.1 hypothetical protein lacNasYZ03_16650 [Lactobacillus nasalidis]
MTSPKDSPVSRIEAGENWQIKNERELLTVNSRQIIYTDLQNEVLSVTIPCDSSDLANFCLRDISNRNTAAPLLIICYDKEPGIPATLPLYFAYDPDLTSKVVELVNYLTKKLALKSTFDEREKELTTKREYERLYGPFRYNLGQLDLFDGNHYRMRYIPSVELRGSECTKDWYLLQPEMDVFFKEDAGRLVATCQGQTLGCLPNPRIANLIRKARANPEQKPAAFIKSIDEKRQVIQLSLAIYQEMTPSVLADLPHVESWLLETDGEDFFGESRQKHLEQVEVGQALSLTLNPPNKQIVVCTMGGNELGCLNEQDTALAMRCNKKLQIFSEICQLDYQHDIRCKVRILFIDPKSQEN